MRDELDHPPRHLRIAGSHNIRDLGGYRRRGGQTTQWRRFLRADSLHRIGTAGTGLLIGEGLTHVIDLRTRAEIADAPSPFAAMSGIAYTNLPVFDALAPDALGRQKGAGGDALLHFYFTTLDTRAAALGEILSALAETGGGLALFNCTAGKDRTGLVAALLLSLAGVEPDEIVADYALTAELIPGLRAEFLELSRRNGGDTVAYEKMLRSPAPTMQAALAKLERDHGGAAAYLADAGVSRDNLDRLRRKLASA